MDAPKIDYPWSILSTCTAFWRRTQQCRRAIGACWLNLCAALPRFSSGEINTTRWCLSECPFIDSFDVILIILDFCFSFFLEKNMLSYFLHIMRQKSGGSSFVCVQLLQTLNILFENIRNETSLCMYAYLDGILVVIPSSINNIMYLFLFIDYLLSNNHVNSIMVHKFDFSDEDVMGYYILFLKTLSLKLNTHTIHFFYNEASVMLL